MSYVQVSAQPDNQIKAKGPQLEKVNDIAIGFRWGNMTGIEVKYWTTEAQALNVSAAFLDNNSAIGANYLYHFRGGVNKVTELRNTDAFVPYVGFGVVAAFGEDTQFFDRNTDDFGFAFRAPIGLEFLTNSPRIGLFAELSPSFAIVPETFTFVTGDIGARFYF